MSKKVFLSLSASFLILLLSGSVLFINFKDDTETLITDEKSSLNWEDEENFTMTVGRAITLEFPQAWSDVVAIDDFSGFSGPDSKAPEYSIPTRVVSFLLGEDFLFDVQSLALEYKGHKDIPSEYEYIGESACRVYYASVSQDSLSADHEKLKQDVPEILKSFALVPGSCSDVSF